MKKRAYLQMENELDSTKIVSMESLSLEEEDDEENLGRGWLLSLYVEEFTKKKWKRKKEW